MDDRLTTAFKAFRLDNDQQTLLDAVEESGGVPAPEEIDFPFCHRICDIKLIDTPYRVTRVLDPKDHSLQLFIYQHDGYSDVPGVPITLRGEGLRRWVETELASESDDVESDDDIGNWGLAFDWGSFQQTEHIHDVDELGFCIIENGFPGDTVKHLSDEIDQAIDKGTTGNIKSSLGETYAARNLAELNPQLLDSWTSPELVSLLRAVLGDGFGLVRILYFDKHPNRTWSLPWHKDMTIAVKDNSIDSDHFSKPTKKSGVAHVEASTAILENMLTLRIHLDDVTDDNGPLEVIPGSHSSGKQTADTESCTTAAPKKIKVGAGDVLAMRPLLSHASGSSTPGTNQHRRILHLEFSGIRQLPDGYQWHLFHQTS